MTLSRVLSKDPNGAKFSGPGVGTDNWLPAGTRVGSTDYAIAHVLLVDASNNPLVTVAVGGGAAHDAAVAGNPILLGGYASATAPSDVSANGDAVRAWLLRNGAQATVLTAAGALIGGDATNGLDVDVTRLPALVAGTAVVGKVGIDQTTPGTTNAVSPLGTGIMAAATASEEGDEAATDEAVFAAGAGTRLMGFSARETTGTGTAVFKIRNGTSNSDPLLVSVSLAAGESAREWYGPDGIASASGIWLERVSGTIEFVGYGKVVA